MSKKAMEGALTIMSMLFAISFIFMIITLRVRTEELPYIKAKEAIIRNIHRGEKIRISFPTEESVSEFLVGISDMSNAETEIVNLPNGEYTVIVTFKE